MQELHILLHRAVLAATTTLSPADWLVTSLLMLTLAMVALPFGQRSGFLGAQTAVLPLRMKAGILCALLASPALTEEFIFRVLPIPQIGSERWFLWALGSLIVFILYHPARTWLRPTPHNQVFTDRRFLMLAGLLGLTCTTAYLLTNSLWPPVIVHWLAVSTWLLLLGGYDRMCGNGGKKYERKRR